MYIYETSWKRMANVCLLAMEMNENKLSSKCWNLKQKLIKAWGVNDTQRKCECLTTTAESFDVRNLPSNTPGETSKHSGEICSKPMKTWRKCESLTSAAESFAGRNLPSNTPGETPKHSTNGEICSKPKKMRASFRRIPLIYVTREWEKLGEQVVAGYGNDASQRKRSPWHLIWQSCFLNEDFFTESWQRFDEDYLRDAWIEISSNNPCFPNDDFFIESWPRFDEDYLRDAWIERSSDNPWFCGKNTSDEVIPMDYPDYNTPITYNALMTPENFGLWVECTKCKKWRKTFEYSESREVPEDWRCSLLTLESSNAEDGSHLSINNPNDLDIHTSTDTGNYRCAFTSVHYRFLMKKGIIT